MAMVFRVVFVRFALSLSLPVLFVTRAADLPSLSVLEVSGFSCFYSVHSIWFRGACSLPSRFVLHRVSFAVSCLLFVLCEVGCADLPSLSVFEVSGGYCFHEVKSLSLRGRSSQCHRFCSLRLFGSLLLSLARELFVTRVAGLPALSVFRASGEGCFEETDSLELRGLFSRFCCWLLSCWLFRCLSHVVRCC